MDWERTPYGRIHCVPDSNGVSLARPGVGIVFVWLARRFRDYFGFGLCVFVLTWP